MSNLRTVLAYVPRYRWAVGLGISSIVAGQVLQNYAPQLLRQGLSAIEVGFADRQSIDTTRVLWLAVAFAVVMAARSFFLWSMRYYTITASRFIEADLRADFHGHLQTLDDSFFARHRTGDLMSRATGDLEAVRSAVGPAVMYIANSLCSVPLALGFMFYMDWLLTLLAMIPLVLIAIVVKWSAPLIMRSSRRVQDVMGRLSTGAQESFAGVRVVKAYAKESREEDVLDRNALDYVDANIEVARVRGVMSGGIRALGSAGVLIVLAYCGFTMMGVRLLGREIDVATLVAFQAYQMSLVWPMMAFGWVFAMFQRGAASLARIQEVLDARPLATPPTPERVVDSAAAPLTGAVAVRNLSFTYPGATVPALVGLDFDLPAGGTLGIVGRTGSGKSTLAHVLTRRYPVARGCVQLGTAAPGRPGGNVDLGDLDTATLSRALAVVPQDAFLFSQTIAGNISFGLPAEPGLRERVEQVARQAALSKDLVQLSAGLDTRVGERGVTLSGGQKQRVAIARALLRRPQLLILDDCLSAVDARTEREILAALREALAGLTAVIISHRISAVRDAQEILVLDHGAVVARGTHEQLIAMRGYYAETWKRQKLEDELGDL